MESDPIGSGLINSFSRPGGQVTGVFFDFPEFSKKWLELLKEVMPQLSSVAVLWDPATGPMQMKGVEIAGKELNVKLEIVEVPGLPNLDEAILAASSKGVDAILMLSSPVFGTNPERIAGLVGHLVGNRASFLSTEAPMLNGRFNRAEQPNKLHIFVVGRATKFAAFA